MYLPILTYHRMLPADSTQANDPKRIAVSQVQFRRHLQCLSWMGYHTVRLENYGQELKRKGRRVGVKSIAITFDDAYEELLTLALPVLEEFGFIATTFAVSGESTNRWDGGNARLMNPAQWRQWKQAGMEMGAHSAHHTHLTQLDPAQARQEIVESKKAIEDGLGSAISMFAYPYGESNPEVESFVEQAGFDVAFATDRAPVDNAVNRYRVRRAVVFPRNGFWEILCKAQKWYPAFQDFKRRRGDTATR